MDFTSATISLLLPSDKTPLLNRARRVDKYTFELIDIIKDCIRYRDEPNFHDNGLQFKERFDKLTKKHKKTIDEHKEFITTEWREIRQDIDSKSENPLSQLPIITCRWNYYVFHQQIYKYEYFYNLCLESINLYLK